MTRIGKLAQGGFSITMAVAVIAALVIVGASGLVVYKHHTNKHPVADSTTTTTPSTANTTSNSTPQPAQTATTYLDIKEWGIKLPLPDSIKDTYYVVPAGTDQDSDGEPGAIAISLASRNAACGTLTANVSDNQNAMVSIVRESPGTVSQYNGKTVEQEDPNGVTIGSWYYGLADAYLKSKPSSCASTADISSLDTAFVAAVKGAVSDTAN